MLSIKLARQGPRVAELLSGHSLDTFRRYWALYERAVAVQNVQAFYLKIEPEQGYCNFAVVGDGKVVDVEGDDSNGSGGISIPQPVRNKRCCLLFGLPNRISPYSRGLAGRRRQS